MEAILLAANPSDGYMWYALPLVIAVSLVYSATRHEEMAPILTSAVRIGVWIIGFMAIIMAVLLLFNWAIL